MKLRKILALFISFTLIMSASLCTSVFAEDTIEFILEDITDSEDTMEGEAKIKVSVNAGSVSADIIQASFTFSGALPYNTPEYLIGSNNISEGKVQQATDASSANASKAFTTSVMSVNTPLSLTGEDDVFVISFAGQPGQSATLNIDTENS